MHRCLLPLFALALGVDTAFAQSLRQPGPAPASGFTSSVAVIGEEILVGRSGAEIRMATYPQAGAVYVFRRDASGAWSVADRIRPADGSTGDQFGRAMASNGELLVVGAPAANEARGAAYVFAREDGRWVERAALHPPAEPDAGAGSAVAIAGDHLFVGAPGGMSDLAALGQPAPPQPGAVFAYRRETDGSWTPAGRLALGADGVSDRFGAALAAFSDELFVGSPAHADGRGAVFRYVADDAGWAHAGTLTRDGGDEGDRYGHAVAPHGDDLLIAIPGADRRGLVVRVTRGPAAGSPEPIAAPGDAIPTAFGAALASNGVTAWVGAPAVSGATGAVYVFEGEPLEHRQTLDLADFGPGAAFGASVAVGETMAVVGASQADLRLGAAAVFAPGSEGWSLEGTLRDPARASVAAITGEQVTCEDGSAGEYDCTDVDLVSFLPLAELGAGPASIANDIWGWTDEQTGREYVLLGKSNGTSFVDITDPENPVYLGELPLHEGALENLWRDIKTYENHAFIVADGAGAHGVQVFDLTQLRDVRDPPATFEETAHYDGVFSSHNIVINEATGFAFAVGNSGGGEPCGGGLHMIDIRDPRSPTFAGCFSDPGTGGFAGAGYTHDAQCVIYEGPDEDFAGREICFHASISALGISDITDKENPVALASADYPGVVAAHQGWLTEDQRYFFLGDELDEDSGTVGRTRTLVWDVAELDDPVLVTEYFANTRAIDHNQYVRGDYLYQSNLMSGLRILDIRDPENPVEVAHFDTVPYDDDLTAFGGSWSNYPFFESGVIAVSSWNEGLFLLKKRETVLVP